MCQDRRCQLTAKNYAILEALLEKSILRADSLVPLLRRKLKTSTVRLWDGIPPDIVTLYSRIVYRIGCGLSESRIVVHSEESSVVGLTLPLTTQRGLALLGLAAGQTTTAQRPDGSVEIIWLEAVAYQPEAARREHSGNNGSAPQS
ncbi:MAG: nucleoside-diphosphate kinase [Dehalococcoidia bacterium]